MNLIKKTIEENWKKLNKKQNLNLVIFKTFPEDKKIIDINLSKMHSSGGGFGGFPDEQYFEHKNLWYVIGKTEDLKKYITLYCLTVLDKKYFGNKAKAFISNQFRDNHFLPSPNQIGVFEIEINYARREQDQIKVKDELRLEENINLAELINIESKIIDLDKHQKFLNNFNISKVLKNVDLSKKVVQDYCDKLTPLYLKNRELCNKTRPLESLLDSIKNAFQNKIIGNKAFFELSEAEKTYFVNKEIPHPEEDKKVRELALSSKNHEEFMKKAKEYIKLTKKQIKTFFQKQIKYNDEILTKNHEFLEQQVFPYFRKGLLLPKGVRK